jgi:hypothetical protein
VFKGVETICEAQVVQEKLDAFVIYVVPVNGFGRSDIELIKKNMQLHVGDVQTEVKPIDYIRRNASKKFRAVVCNLSLEEKRQIQDGVFCN